MVARKGQGVRAAQVLRSGMASSNTCEDLSPGDTTPLRRCAGSLALLPSRRTSFAAVLTPRIRGTSLPVRPPPRGHRALGGADRVARVECRRAADRDPAGARHSVLQPRDEQLVTKLCEGRVALVTGAARGIG